MEIKIISITLILFAIIIIVWGIYMIHLYPGKVAKQRKHPQLKAIEVTSVMGLLIFPLWILALIWAHSNAIFGKLYNEGDFTADDQGVNEPEPPLFSSKPEVETEQTDK